MNTTYPEVCVSLSVCACCFSTILTLIPLSRLRAAAVDIADHRGHGGQVGSVALAVDTPLQRFSRLWGSLDLS